MKANIVNFLENFVAPFLVWQFYYDAHQKPPPWGERSHFVNGIIEYYSELLDMKKCQYVVEFMKLLARKNRPKGHELCPAAQVRGIENVTGNCFTAFASKLIGKMLPLDLLTVLRDERSKF